MLNKPIISKIRVNNPNLYNSRVKNRNHLVYIGTRDGVDISEPLLDQDFLDKESSNEVYLKYIHERPNSHGLFGNVDVSDIVKLGNDLANETANGKCVYRGILSLSEEDALELGYDQKKKWMELIQRVMPDISEEFNIPVSHLQYCAAVHKEQRHPHCHYMFWDDRNGKIQSPYIHTSKQNRIREKISGIINEESIRQEVFNKTLQRDLILDLNREMMESELNSILSNQDKISGRIRSSDINATAVKLLKLTEMLPEHGRMVYQYMPKDIKNKVDSLVDDILKVSAIHKEYDKYIEHISNLSNEYSASERHSDYTEDKNILDIKKRIANQILKTCKKVSDISLVVDDVSDIDNFVDIQDEFAETEEYIFEGKEQDILENKNSDIKSYVMDWNKKYKSAIKQLYDPKIKDISNVLEILNEQAENGNVLAMNELGKIYARGIHIEKNPDIAEKYYTDAFHGFKRLREIPCETEAKTEWRKHYCNYRIGKMYESGFGTEQNYEKAIECYQMASDNKYAQYSLASMYLRHKGIEVTLENEESYYRSALELLMMSSKNGNVFAKYALASNSEKRNILELPHDMIQKYYADAFNGFDKMLKEKEDDFLLYRVGTMFYKGNGVKQDKEKAFECFKQSAEFNNPNALYAVGKYYADKKMNYYDPVKAEKCFLDAIRNGNEYAYCTLASLYLDNESVLYDVDKGVDILKKISDENSAAQYVLAKVYVDKENKYYDIGKGIDLLKKCISEGNISAMYSLGKIYADKESTQYDIKNGIKYLQLASEGGNSYAMIKLGNIYLWGKHEPDIKRNEELGLKYLNDAMEHGNDCAKDMINFYENYKTNMMPALSYSMLQSINKFFYHSSENTYQHENLKQYARRSKEYLRDQAEKNENGAEL